MRLCLFLKILFLNFWTKRFYKYRENWFLFNGTVFWIADSHIASFLWRSRFSETLYFLNCITFIRKGQNDIRKGCYLVGKKLWMRHFQVFFQVNLVATRYFLCSHEKFWRKLGSDHMGVPHSQPFPDQVVTPITFLVLYTLYSQYSVLSFVILRDFKDSVKSF